MTRVFVIVLMLAFALLALVPLGCLYAVLTPKPVVVQEIGDAADFATLRPSSC